MKLFVTVLACVIAYVTACGNMTIQELTPLKCDSDIAFRGQLSRGMSSQFNDGPYRYNFRRDTFDIISDYKDNLSGSEVTVFGIYPADGLCSGSPFDASDALVFAKLNSTYNMYEVFPCSKNPASECIDLEAFDDILC